MTIKIETTDSNAKIRHDWSLAEAKSLFALPFNDLIFAAQQVHREHFDANAMQISTLCSIKTGGCTEDCAYCPQSAHFKTPVKAQKMMEVEEVLAEAARAKDAGASRFCMGAAWRSPKDRDMQKIIAMIKGVKELGLESCATLGMLTAKQTAQLKAAGLDYYNHNIDSSEEFYGEIISTRSYRQRLDTLEQIREAGINICCGGIVGMGESEDDRAQMLVTLATMPTHPQSVPINMLVTVAGTPLADAAPVDPFAFVRTIAAARIMMPASYIRLSAGRENMSDELQALCFLAGANSIFYGEKLLTTANPQTNKDQELLARLGIAAA